MTRQEFRDKWKPISGIVASIAHAMEEANKADGGFENGINSRIAGEPFNLLDKAWRSAVSLQYNNDTYLHVNWGGDGEFNNDIKSAAFDCFVRSEYPEETLKK